MDKPYEQPRAKLLSTVVIFVFVLFLLYSAFLFVKNMRVEKEIVRVGEESAAIESEIDSLKAKQIEELLNAENRVDSIRAGAVEWSSVVKKLQDLNPVEVFYKSYSASEDGSIKISAFADSYESVSSLISSLSDSDDFLDVFVSSASLGETSDGQSIVSFNIEIDSSPNSQ